MGFCIVVDLFAYGVASVNGSQQMIVMGTLLGGNEGACVDEGK